MFYSLLYKLDMEYWVLHTGTDGYLYLLFQRRFFKLTLYLTGLSMVFSFLLNFQVREKSGEESWDLEIFFYRATLDNKQFDS